MTINKFYYYFIAITKWLLSCFYLLMYSGLKQINRIVANCPTERSGPIYDLAHVHTL